MMSDMQGEIKKDIFEDLYKNNLKVFEDFAFFILGNTEQAEDVVADCFIRLWNERARVSREKAMDVHFHPQCLPESVEEIFHQKRGQRIKF